MGFSKKRVQLIVAENRARRLNSHILVEDFISECVDTVCLELIKKRTVATKDVFDIIQECMNKNNSLKNTVDTLHEGKSQINENHFCDRVVEGTLICLELYDKLITQKRGLSFSCFAINEEVAKAGYGVYDKHYKEELKTFIQDNIRDFTRELGYKY
jgi:hypothetical protein